MSKLIVLSNRVNLPSGNAGKAIAGGLAVAIKEALAEEGGVWMGWNGTVLPDDTTDGEFASEQHEKVTYVTTALTPTQYEKYYCGYANNRLWAGLHDRTDLIVSSSEDFAVYQAVNAMFAKALQTIAEPDDVIWVHDYHFFGVATQCRALGMQQRIGFFLHIPFPKQAVWEYLTHGKTLIGQLASYDVIGLQTVQDQQNCCQVMQQLLPAAAQRSVPQSDSQPDSLDGPKSEAPGAQTWVTLNALNTVSSLHAHSALVKAYPIGVNPAHIRGLASQRANLPPLPAALNLALTTVIAVERLDYTKGIPERLQAFAEFLQRYPQYIGRIQLHQIACPSRLDIQAYQMLRTRVHALVAQINAAIGTNDWQPIVYQEQPVSHEALMPLLRICDICWVNSLKDGMNLVAKEYIAAQDDKTPGVLILSKNTGAAQQLQQAVLVDPHTMQSMIDGLYTAVTMPPPLRKQRHALLRDGLYQADINRWRDAFLRDLTDNNTPQPV